MNKLPRRNYEINAIINKRNEKFIVIFTIALSSGEKVLDWQGGCKTGEDTVPIQRLLG